MGELGQSRDKFMGPLVSVVIPVFNGEKFLRRSINSVLTQTYPHLQIIVVDDGSTDASIKLLEEYRDGITVIQQENMRVAAARNTGIGYAQGEYVAFLDQDDEWYPQKIATQIEEFSSNDVALGSLLHYSNPESRIIGIAGEDALERNGDIRQGKLMPFPPSSLIVRRAALETIGGFDADLGRIAPVDDLDLLMRLSTLGTIRTVMQPLGIYRIHGSAETFSAFSKIQEGTRFLRARVKTPDLTWEDFRLLYQPTALQRRLDTAKYHYRRAGLRFATRHYVRASAHFALSMFLHPIFTIRRATRQVGAKGGMGREKSR